MSLQTLFSRAITSTSPYDNGSEASFITLWDYNIRLILDLLLPTGISIRDSDHHPEIEAGFRLSTQKYLRLSRGGDVPDKYG
jgi:hypothetical protein